MTQLLNRTGRALLAALTRLVNCHAQVQSLSGAADGESTAYSVFGPC